VNYKKVFYHLAERGRDVQTRLKWMCAMFHVPTDELVARDNSVGASPEDIRLEQLSIRRSVKLHQECAYLKAAMRVFRDVRLFTKEICCVPRHPDNYKQTFLAGDEGIW
jgi:hypothetical protein